MTLTEGRFGLLLALSEFGISLPLSVNARFVAAAWVSFWPRGVPHRVARKHREHAPAVDYEFHYGLRVRDGVIGEALEIVARRLGQALQFIAYPPGGCGWTRQIEILLPF
jgi:hypothetical protein